ncbi:MAG: hypothetical protein ACREQQ_00965 [Candidatus Binatia bacterium]
MKRGPLFWVAVLAVVVGGGYLAWRYATDRILSAYTEASPLDIGEPAFSPSEFGGIDGRLAAFVHALRNKTPIEPLTLSDDDLTALVARAPEFRRLGARARFAIRDDAIHGDFSLPLERIGYPDRWFNGSGTFAAKLENGVLVVTLQSVSVKGEPIPDWFVRQFRERNLAKEIHESPLAAGLIARLESIEIGDGRITIVPRIRR